MSDRSSVVVVIEPNTTLTWDQFLFGKPRGSIALDGYVTGGPRFDPKGPRMNLNHHEEVDRLATRATCAQTLMAIRQGLFHSFAPGKTFVYVNDCDEDVSLSCWLLKHHYLVEGTMNPAINRLVFMEDMLDATAGAYPFPPSLPMLAELAWIFEPYRACRMSGELDTRNVGVFSRVICDVGNRIGRYAVGEGEAIPLDVRYEHVERHPAFAVIREIGAHAKTGAFADGIRAYLSVRGRADGKVNYTIGRMSTFVPFDVPKILEALNALEPGWGGANTVGGSPRATGSSMTVDDVVRVITGVLGSSAGV